MDYASDLAFPLDLLLVMRVLFLAKDLANLYMHIKQITTLKTVSAHCFTALVDLTPS